MLVRELIEKLEKVDQNATVNCYAGYDLEFGAQWSELKFVEVDNTGWDEFTNTPIAEVFFK